MSKPNKTDSVSFRLTPGAGTALRQYCDRHDTTPSDLFRTYIQELTVPQISRK